MTKFIPLIVCLALIAIHVQMDSAVAGDNAAQASRIAVQADLLNLSARAQQYYWRAANMGGGGHSFVGLTADSPGLGKLTMTHVNQNGHFSISTLGSWTSVELTGIGVEKGDDTNPVKVKILVFADSVAVTFTN